MYEMYEEISCRRARFNGRGWRVWRFLLSLPVLLRRGWAFPYKKRFLKRLVNTYHGNRINLALTFRGKYSDLQIRWIALKAVGVYVRNTLLYNGPKMWRGYDVYNAEALERALAQKKGVVVAGQHLGPQRYSFVEIAATGLPTLCAITQDFVDTAQGWLDRVERDLGAGPEVEAIRRIRLQAVEEPTSALKMMRALRRGEAVMFDMDGNIGVGGEEKTLQSSMELSFLGRQVHVRRGVAYLGYRSGAPILPVIVLWGRGGRPEIHFFEPLMAEEEESLEVFSERALKILYGLLEEVLTTRPEQWEMWSYFYKWLTPPAKLEDREAGAPVVDLELVALRESLEKSPDVRLGIRPELAFVMRIRGRYLFVDSLNFRFFFVSDVTRRLLRILYRGSTLTRIVRTVGAEFSQDAVLRELARFRALRLLEQHAVAV